MPVSALPPTGSTCTATVWTSAITTDSNRVRVRVTNERHILTIHYSLDEGETWTKYDTQMDVSGYHHNVAYGFMSLRPAIYAAGEGSVRFSDLEYRALP